MVATPLLMPLWMWATALAGSTLVFQTFVKPRLPVYRLQVHGLPTLKRLKGEWTTQLPTRVRLFNENYLPIDVHALQFDIFVTHAADGSLQHVGHIQDRHQQDLSAEYLQHAISPSSWRNQHHHHHHHHHPLTTARQTRPCGRLDHALTLIVTIKCTSKSHPYATCCRLLGICWYISGEAVDAFWFCPRLVLHISKCRLCKRQFR